jgi:hypothetical protein
MPLHVGQLVKRTIAASGVTSKQEYGFEETSFQRGSTGRQCPLLTESDTAGSGSPLSLPALGGPAKTIDAQCRCGVIELGISGDPIVQLYRHCDDCQVAHSAACAPAAIYPAQAADVVRGDPAPMVVKTTQRMRCVACGTYLFPEIASVGARSVSGRLLPKGRSNRSSTFNAGMRFFRLWTICLTIRASRRLLAALKNLSAGRFAAFLRRLDRVERSRLG